jgi:aspartate aminotransferase
VGGDKVIMTVGAGGALNIALKSMINPGDEVLVFTPCFMEYGYYVDNHGGTLKFLPSEAGFEPDLEALREAVNEKTAGLIINSPNNPTGKVYSEKTIIALANVLRECSKKTGRAVYLLSDEPYRKIVYDGVTVAPLFKHYEHSVVTTSFSKDLSLPGERIGFLAVNPQADDADNLVSAMILCNRILGYVNAPAIMQNAVCDLLEASVDVGIYQKRRDIFYESLTSMGYEMTKPEGTFYLFPRAPGGDDMKIVDALQEENILVVPGRGFKAEGYFRIAFCVDESVIQRSLPGFERAIKKIRGEK